MTAETQITPVLLCGGSGQRLWPLSRKSYPKQFTPLLGEHTLFQTAVQRFDAPGFGRPVVVTSADFRFIVAQQLAELGIAPAAILLEPEPRNTAPAVMSALAHIAATGLGDRVAVSPCDHLIPNTAAFLKTLRIAQGAVQDGRIVTVGIPPEWAETGFGYIETEAPPTPDAPVALKRFVEKPGPEAAEALIEGGQALWNSGIFLGRVDAFWSECARHQPGTARAVEVAYKEATSDLGFLRLDPGAWKDCKSQSIDHAVMEHSDRLSVIRYDAGWSDLGNWQAIHQVSEPDADGNVCSGQVVALDCRNSLLRSEDDKVALTAIGLDRIVAVAMPDAVLIAPLDRSQDVSRAIPRLQEAHQAQATEFPKCHRPWGWFEGLVRGDRFQVKRIQVDPGQALSLQSHHHRAEHWVVVQGTAKVTLGEDIHLLGENQSVYIPLGTRHRLENPGLIPLVLIEIQTGSYLGEDDITRFEDSYARGTGEDPSA